ncbi:ATP-grasp domain-containing protein [Streptomyces mauvecolor]
MGRTVISDTSFPLGPAATRPGYRPRVVLVGWRPHAAAALRHLEADLVCVCEPELYAAARAGTNPDTDTVLLVADPTDAEQVLSALARNGLGAQQLTTVASDGEFTITAAALVASALGLPGMNIDTAIALRDKFAQKALIARAGLATADCHVVDTLSGLEGIPMPLPFVVKPLAGAAARDTHAVHDPADLRALAESENPAAPPSGPWLVETFTHGAELHLDGIVRNGSLVALGVSRYLQRILSIRSGGLVGSVVLSPERHAALYADAHRHVETALRALGHHDGIFHLEAFLDEGMGESAAAESRLTFSECGGRSGGGMIREAMTAKFRVSLADAWARATLGEPQKLPSEPTPESVGWVNLPAPAGTVETVPTETHIRARPGVLDVRLGIAVGDVMPDVSTSSFARAGVALVSGPDEETVERRLRDLAAWFSQSVSIRPAADSREPVSA